MDMSDAEAGPQLGPNVDTIVAACAWLQERGVQVCLHLCSKAGGQLLPSTEAIRALAQFLSSIDFHSVPDLLATTSPFVHGCQACFTDALVEALPSASQSLQTLCISGHVYGQLSPTPSQIQISLVAALSNLTKLHLTMGSQPDFRPLAQLTKIEDLALQCSGFSSDCSRVIDSNQHGLQRLIIASCSWTDSTYAAAANVETLRTVVVKVATLTEAGAALVANLVHPGSVQVLIGCCHQMSQRAFLLLSSGRAKITVLELWSVDADQCKSLQTMHSLHKMTLMQPCFNETDTVFTNLQPQLTDLRLISCLQLNHCALANMIQSLPALQRFAFQQESHIQPPAGTRSFCSTGLLMFNQASKLRVVNLEGAQGLTDEMVYAFEADFRAQHRNEARRRLALKLPTCSETRNTLYHSFHVHYPVSWYTAAKQHKPYWVCLSSPAKPGWDAHLRKRCTPSRAERMRNAKGVQVTKDYRFKRNIRLGEYMFETCKIPTTIYAKPLLSFREHVDQDLADVERERG